MTGTAANKAATRDHTAAARHTRIAARLEAVLFDMDGVVTDTAQVHAATWKRLFDEYLAARAKAGGEAFRPFDEQHDYRDYVDGKPRYDGVRSFLAARGISLPYGNESDEPGAETICGLGNRKNRYVGEWLKANSVRPVPGTLRLITELRKAGLKVAVFSASRNAEAVLHSAGVLHLFDAKVDGNDLAERGLPGKPDPAMLHEAAARLGVPPENTAVVEDAVAGTEAGAAGRFALVIGVNRNHSGAYLGSHGADLVAHDLAELTFDRNRGFLLKTPHNLPPVWQHKAELRSRFGDKKLVVLLDYDGTLTPIVLDFTKAFLAGDMRKIVAALAALCTVGIVSGRDLADVKRLVGLEPVFYVGSHGFDMQMPGGGRETLGTGDKFLPDLDVAEQKLRQAVRGIPGVDVERKRFAIAVHYRRAAAADIGWIRAAVDGVIAHLARLHTTPGKMVFQVLPRIDWDKGRAISCMLERLDLDGDDVLPVYVGDDLTDEDAFRALAGRGIGIVVGDETRPTAADYRLADPDDVRRFLCLLIDVLSGDA